MLDIGCMSTGSTDSRQRPRPDPLLAARLVDAREDAGLSQMAVAERVGVSAQTISQWETAARKVPTGRLVQLASIYNVDAALLLKGPSEYRVPTDERAIRVLQGITELPESDADDLLDVAETLLRDRLRRLQRLRADTSHPSGVANGGDRQQ